MLPLLGYTACVSTDPVFQLAPVSPREVPIMYLFYLYLGGDDRRVLLWNVEEGISSCAKPVSMKGEHHSNIFCLAFDNSNAKIFSGGTQNNHFYF